MTLPTWLLKRRGSAREADVVVVGAGLAGLVCGCVLARSGRRVVVVDRARRAGGRLKTIQYQGFAVDLGPVLWEAPDLPDALAAAGVADTAWTDIDVRRQVRLACMADDGALGKALPIPVPGAVPSPSTLDAVRELYGVPPRVFASLGDHYAGLAALDDEELAAQADTTIEDWLVREEVEKPVAQALRRSAVVLGASDPAHASVAALARRVRVLGADGANRLVTFGDGPIAGGQGVVGALVDSLIAAGGELRLGTQAVGIAVDERRCAGLAVCREEQPFLEAIEAPDVVLAVPREGILSLLPSESGLEIEPNGASTRSLGVAWGIRDEAGEEADDAPAVLESVPAASATAPGGADRVSVFRASALAPRVAPPGAALVLGRASLPAGSAADPGTIESAMAALRAAREVVLPGAEEAVLWEHHWLAEEDGADPMRTGSLPDSLGGTIGVRLANAEVRLPGIPSAGAAAAARAGRHAAERILAG